MLQQFFRNASVAVKWSASSEDSISLRSEVFICRAEPGKQQKAANGIKDYQMQSFWILKQLQAWSKPDAIKNGLKQKKRRGLERVLPKELKQISNSRKPDRAGKTGHAIANCKITSRTLLGPHRTEFSEVGCCKWEDQKGWARWGTALGQKVWQSSTTNLLFLRRRLLQTMKRSKCNPSEKGSHFQLSSYQTILPI